MLVSVDDLQAYMQYTPESPGGLNNMATVLQRAQKAVETTINRPVERVQVREVVRSDSKGYLYLRVTPVWKVISCGGTTAPTTPDTESIYEPVLDPSLPEGTKLLNYGPSALLDGYSVVPVPGRLWVGIPWTYYVIDYIGGLDPDDIDDIKGIILAVSARIFGQNNLDNAGQRQGDVDTVNIGDNRVPWLSDDEIASLQRYRRRVIR